MSIRKLRDADDCQGAKNIIRSLECLGDSSGILDSVIVEIEDRINEFEDAGRLERTEPNEESPESALNNGGER